MTDYVYARITSLLNEQCKSVNGSEILLLGLAYKRGTSDWRESPSVVVLVDHAEFDTAIGAPHGNDIRALKIAARIGREHDARPWTRVREVCTL